MQRSIRKDFPKIGWILILVLPILLSACGGPPNVDWELTITGDVEIPTTFTLQELAEMPQTNLDDVLMEKSRGEDEVRSFTGVKMSTLFEIVGAPEDYTAITAKAADGYAIEISKDEMVNAIVALKDSGEWVIEKDPNDGAMRLVTPTTPANRWVFQLTEIVVNQ
jgi:DMSO/TMAO reductase YedYZ molybdopterin-dependent catalytic subunit